MLFFFKNLILCYVYKCFACMCVCAPHECSTQGDQQGAFHPVDLEFQMVVRHHVGVKNWTLSLVEKLSMPLTIEPSQWCLLMRRLFKSIYLYFLLELVLPDCLRSQEVFTLTAKCLLSSALCLGQRCSSVMCGVKTWAQVFTHTSNHSEYTLQ